jgi:hypothetical protein
MARNKVAVVDELTFSVFFAVSLMEILLMKNGTNSISTTVFKFKPG